MELINGKTLHDWIAEATAPEIPTLWGDKFPEYQPYLCKNKIGDGLQLIYVGTFLQVPYHWLVLIDSHTDINADDFDIDPIMQHVTNECGYISEDDYNNTESACCHYPLVVPDSCFYGLIVNFGEVSDGN